MRRTTCPRCTALTSAEMRRVPWRQFSVERLVACARLQCNFKVLFTTARGKHPHLVISYPRRVLLPVVASAWVQISCTRGEALLLPRICAFSDPFTDGCAPIGLAP